jgi:uncharacterized membrane protein
MFDFIYDSLAKIGYTHPLHPAVTHLTIGLVMGSFIFLIIGFVLKKSQFFITARYVIILAAATVPITVLLGYMDWQHFYRGAWLFSFQMKFLLAGLLSIFLIVSILLAFINQKGSGMWVITQAICLLAVIGLGFFGGELVYKPVEKASTKIEGIPEELASKGKVIFESNCSMCHYSDRTEESIGPGLKGLFQMEKLPVSGNEVTEKNIQKQLLTPFKDMPDFADLAEDDIQMVIAFLKTI